MSQGRRVVVSVIAIAVSVGLAGCGAANRGGDTTCGDYLAMSSGEQTAVIEKHYADKGKTSLSNGEISMARASAVLYCRTAGSDSSPIKNIDG